MKRLGAALAAAGLAVLAFTGCAPAIDHGDVIGKEYTAPYDYMYYQCYSYRQDMTCSFGMWETRNVGAVYKVKVLDSTGKDAWLNVSAEEYASLEKGDYYDSTP